MKYDDSLIIVLLVLLVFFNAFLFALSKITEWAMKGVKEDGKSKADTFED